MSNTKSLTARAFNEWMRRYIKEPERYEAEFNEVIRFKREGRRGREPSYGEGCEAYLAQIKRELAKKQREARCAK